MNLNLAAGFVIATLAIVNPLGKIPIRRELPGGEPVRPEVTPSLVATALLEKTIFRVDVVSLELWLGPETTLEVRRHPTAGKDSLAAAVAGSRDAWVQLVFQRDVGLDRFLAGVNEDMQRAVHAGLLDTASYAKVATGLPVWLTPLRERGIAAGDRFTYAIVGDTLRTVFTRQDGEVVIDQTDVGPAHRRALLGSFMAPGAGFRDDLLADLQWKAERP
jgi:hypothetical protein